MYTSCLAYIAVTKQQVRVRRHPLHLAPSLLALGVAYLPAITEAGAGVTARPKIAHNFYSVQKRNINLDGNFIYIAHAQKYGKLLKLLTQLLAFKHGTSNVHFVWPSM